jgi:hypothetical protein
MYRLPVSGARVSLREMTGAEELLFAEGSNSDSELELAIVSRLAERVDDEGEPWEEFTPTDLDALLLAIRQKILGETISGDSSCPVPACGARVDISFSVGQYLDHQRPRKPRDIESTDEPGWYRLQGSPATFRLPNGGDLLAVHSQPDPVSELVRRCVRPPDQPTRWLRRIERAMDQLAPSPTTELKGTCPDCGHSFNFQFDPRQFALRELRDQAAFIYEDVHLIAEHYGWSEAEIMSLPHNRRVRYAELIREERGGL